MRAMKETERAASRRRWITLGEVVGILALVVSALSYWDAHQERTVAAKATAAAGPSRPAGLVLTAAVEDGGDRLALRPAGADQVIQTQTIRFPTMVAPSPVETTGNARIEASWFEPGLRTALKGAKLHAGRHRLPAVIETTYLAGGTTATDRALYDVGYSLHARLLRPDVATLEGLSFVRRGGGDLQAMADARFVRSLPAAKPQ